jgi:hypothetical protein
MGGPNLSEHHLQYDKGIKLAGRNSTWNMGQTLPNKQFYLLEIFERLISGCSFRYPFFKTVLILNRFGRARPKKNKHVEARRVPMMICLIFFCSVCCVFGCACLFVVRPGYVSKCCMANCEGWLFHRCVGALVCETVWCENFGPNQWQDAIV